MNTYNTLTHIFIGSVIGITITFITSFLRKKDKQVKKGILDIMKDTPLIYIKSLSELTNCEIYGKCEYFLPYTSKDRIIKNIILTAQRSIEIN